MSASAAAVRYLLSLLVLIPYALRAQPQTIVPQFDTITVSFNFYETPYLHREEAMDTSRRGYHPSLAGNWLSFAGHDRAARGMIEGDAPAMGMDTARYTRFTEDFRAVPAVPALLEEAEAHEIVILNEAHHEPRHRAFARELLQGLYDRGYRHFGLETLATGPFGDSLLQTVAYPTLGIGYYTRDPQFAAMLQAARDIGLHPFAYEASHEDGDGPRERERKQMENIVAYRAAHPEGKLLLYVGYDHATEGEMGGSWDRAMAQRLADTTGLDPLTINQTHFREMNDTLQERYEYRAAVVREPSVFVNDAGEDWSFGEGTRWFDRYVFHPRTVYRFGRPDYVYAHGAKPVLIDFTGLEAEGPYLVQAYASDDDITQAVPRDVVETGRDAPRALALRPGKYRLLVRPLSGTSRVASITVD